MIVNNKKILFISFLFLSLSTSGFFMVNGINNYIAYLGYSIIVIKTILTFIKNRSFRRETLTFSNFIIILALLIGIMVQHMDASQKIRLILTMILITNFTIFSRGVAVSFEDIRAGAHGIFLGIILVFFVGIITGFPLFGINNEGYLPFAFTAGFLHKNIFGFILLASFSGIFIYWKFVSKRKIDLFILLIEVFFLILSNARGALLLAVAFFIFINIKFFIRLIKLNINKFIFLIFLLFLGSFYYLFNRIALNSGTFNLRLNGLLGWFFTFRNDNHVLFFGNAAEVFTGSNDYVAVVRGMINWVGTAEMGLLSILVKNGIIGIIGYTMIFLRAFKSMKRTQLLKFKLPLLALLISMILSLLTAAYLVNSTVCYGAFSFLVLSTISTMATKLEPPKARSTGKLRKYILKSDNV